MQKMKRYDDDVVLLCPKAKRVFIISNDFNGDKTPIDSFINTLGLAIYRIMTYSYYKEHTDCAWSSYEEVDVQVGSFFMVYPVEPK